MQPRNVGSLLASDAGLQPVISRVRLVNALSKHCFDFLPPELARLVRAVNFHDRPGDRQLVLYAASSTAAAKLKLLAEALRSYLCEQRAEVNSVSVRVQPGAAAAPDAAPRRAPRLSASALADLQALYRRLPESPARRALKALLDHRLKS